MDTLMMGCLAAVSLMMLRSGLDHRGGIFEYPFLAGATFLGFVLPSLPGLMQDRFLPPGALTLAIAFTTGCAGMCIVGWRAGRKPIAWMARLELDETRALWAAAALSVMGAFFFHKLGDLPDDIKNQTMASGLPTIYLFLAEAVFYGFALAVLCCARSASRLAVAIVGFDLLILGSRVLVTGKRGETTQIALIILLALWFRRNYAFPRIPALIGIVAASLSVASVGDYRGLVKNDDYNAPAWSQVANIPLVENFKTLLANGGDEMRNATLRMADINNRQSFDFGLYNWDALVWAFVPAQLLGADFKQALLFPVPAQPDLNYQPSVGTTETGMTDAFASFWYFGVLKFFLIAYAMGRLYRTALSGAFVAQLVYMLSVTSSILAITHYTQWIFNTWIGMGLLLTGPLLFSRRRQASGSASAQAVAAPYPS
jgi:ABC-type multidrug transport system fused ATPase/permease subunit